MVIILIRKVIENIQKVDAHASAFYILLLQNKSQEVAKVPLIVDTVGIYIYIFELDIVP
ncbi:MAG: hypothetical protein ACI9H6_000466 [Patiriisocius sp.]|jgi:hypothetical protein